MLYTPARRMIFHHPVAAPDPGASQFVIRWSAEAEISLGAAADDLEAMVARLQSLVELLAGNPRLVEAAVRGGAKAIRAAGLDYIGVVDVPPPATLREAAE